MNPTIPVSSPRGHTSLSRVVPRTELRQLYRLLRHSLVSTAVQIQIAKEFCRDPKKLQSLVQRSRDHFAHYDNRGEAFHRRKGVGILSSGVLASPKPVHEVNRRVRQFGIRSLAEPMLDANYVDYELSPTRTTDSIHETGKPSRAGGGIDLLLTNANDRLPVLVEAKGATDRNLFLGLIQP